MSKFLNHDQVIEDLLQKIKDNNPYGFILRPELKEKTGGLLNGRYHANLDSLGKGIENRFLVGNTTAYPVDSVIKFLRKKISIPGIKSPSPPKQKKQINIQSSDSLSQEITGPSGEGL